MQFGDNTGPDRSVQADQGLCYPLTESMGTVIYIHEQRMLRSDCMDVHADLDLHCQQIVYRALLHAYISSCLVLAFHCHHCVFVVNSEF